MMSEQILRQAMAVHQAADDGLRTSIAADVGVDENKRVESLVAIAASHLQAATHTMRLAGFSHAQVARWLYQAADSHAAPGKG